MGETPEMQTVEPLGCDGVARGRVTSEFALRRKQEPRSSDVNRKKSRMRDGKRRWKALG